MTYDLFMLMIVVAAMLWGYWKGFAWQLASLASIVVSYFVALNLRNPLATMFSSDPNSNIFTSMLVLFCGTSGGVWATYHFISDLITKVKLRDFDRQIGAMFGLVKGVLICVIITLFSVTLLGEQSRQAIVNSRSGYYIANLLVQSEAFMPREIQQVLAPYLPVQQTGYPTYTNAPANSWQPNYEPSYYQSQQQYVQPQQQYQQPPPGYGYPPGYNQPNPYQQYQPYPQQPPYPQYGPYDPRITDQPRGGNYYAPPVDDWRR